MLLLFIDNIGSLYVIAMTDNNCMKLRKFFSFNVVSCDKLQSHLAENMSFSIFYQKAEIELIF